ncbi:hypothetical protein PpBr36_00928 [Pyricularia pennisetigena]|uniref:hypothetical protein n=1 Tax=Pyricularia pennisetigena TaxID=1578925 RepID=UPI0011543115|nr:hypothetical protein PpBr36_00928 [Pyricularia pennisetigena]TLS29270.1 hypothetical protein PpBr36_00928 [Pyricularia pennisetigena]
MDAPEEDLDIKLQKISGDLIADFDRSLRPLLRRADGTVRSRVRTREALRLTISLLDPFQELPQLLDPYLAGWSQALADAFLEYYDRRRRRSTAAHNKAAGQEGHLMSLPAAVCRIMYTLCKIRGEKVVVRLLSVETRYLELLLSVLEESERAAAAAVAAAPNDTGFGSPENSKSESDISRLWTWEERYVVLLWLSHLFLAPFDLASISSVDLHDDELPEIPGLQWPPNVPGIALRVLPMAIKYLGSPGKERDAAKALLVRIAMRRDMQELGILHALLQWALFALRPSTKGAGGAAASPYYYIGVLSFLAGLLASSADTSDMDRYLKTVFYTTYNISSNSDDVSKLIASSALARKIIIKIVRSIAILVLRRTSTSTAASLMDDKANTVLVETAVGHALDLLSDNDTPVRFAASKALSVITLRLEPELASQVVDAVLEALERNVLWVKSPGSGSGDATTPARRTRDMSLVDPLEWHGLMLSLSHLLYRRSPPAENLAKIIQALLTGLSFERRGTSGAPMGTNVRDAACFGIWALARRYTTVELLAVPVDSFCPSAPHGRPPSVIQVLATQLTVTASLDPSGNIRRGSSAALQELVGRHPDTVEQGIWLVQTVDYHAVALRSRATSKVSLGATRLSDRYGDAVLEALLGWRGIGDGDAAARRVAGSTFGTVTRELAVSGTAGAKPLDRVQRSIDNLFDRISELQNREVEERHGLLLSLAAVLDTIPELLGDGLGAFTTLAGHTLQRLATLLDVCVKTNFRRPELVAEAASLLIVSSFPLLQIVATDPTVAHGETSLKLLPGAYVATPAFSADELISIKKTVKEARSKHTQDTCLHEYLLVVQAAVNEWLGRSEQEVIDAASVASLILLIFLGDGERGELESAKSLLAKWAQLARQKPTSSRAGIGAGYFFALTMAHRVIPRPGPQPTEAWDADATSSLITGPLVDRWRADASTEVRVAILQSLTGSGSSLLRDNMSTLLVLVTEGLDDYTVTARGDVGSHVRLQAIKVTKGLWKAIEGSSPGDEKLEVAFLTLFPKILRLSAEKLDKVRAEAQTTLALALNESWALKLRRSTYSSRPYHSFLLNLPTTTSERLHASVSAAPALVDTDGSRWMEELMTGYVTSADAGHEDLVIASRGALATYCARSQENLDRACGALARCLARLSRQQPQPDRVVVPMLNVTAFLFHVGVFSRCRDVDYKALCLAVQRCGYKTGNVRKLEACVRVYGAVAGMGVQGEGERQQQQQQHQRQGQQQMEGVREARKRLGALLLHPWPRVRSFVVDELWVLLSDERDDASAAREGGDSSMASKLKGVDWGGAGKDAVKELVEQLGLT